MKIFSRKFVKKLFFAAFIFGFISLIFIIASDKITTKKSKPFIFNDIKDVPHNNVALLLGTKKDLANGSENRYFTSRITAAVALYKAGKFDKIIISGDNSRTEYNEPEDMRQALISQGVPDSVIILDFAGFRTFDSVIRCNKIFGQDSFLVISQPFHNERAVYIARTKGIKATAFNSEAITGSYAIKVVIREYFARAKMMLDLYILNTEPHFYGEKIAI
ncbi:MAG: YdcF family protein [Bacteroidia bacterium]|nr:YdcF family protein [Bacteroidia bacterium]